jgi:hypothetical protein
MFSLFEALFSLFTLDIPSQKAKKYHNFVLCPCSFGATESLFCPIGHNGFSINYNDELASFYQGAPKVMFFLKHL